MSRRILKNPAFTTRTIADWLGTTTEYVRSEIATGALPAANVSRTARKEYRVRYSQFLAYLKRKRYPDSEMPRVSDLAR
jgi:excisionase family DNA binding protein